MSRTSWRSIFAGFACLVILTTAAVAEPGDTSLSVIEQIDQDFASGKLTTDQAMLYKFQVGFEPTQLPIEYRPAVFMPLKSGTGLMVEYERIRDELAPETVAAIDGFLQRPQSTKEAQSTYISPSGFFLLTYTTTGTDAVPTTDTNPANGIPDYVEKVAGYCDYSQDFECNTLGFTTPPHAPYYYIYFESMGYYGYTSPVSTYGSNITLHNNYFGFPSNDDPEGNQWGAAKVTVAHEFKHATQRAGSRWTEGGWVEVDATWMEDIAYDYVNDYYNYLPSGSPISSPTTSLDSGGSGSYEDCVFQHWMSETWGNQIITDLWNYRKTHTSVTMMNSYNQMLVNYGSSLVEGWPVFTAWNYACGTLKSIPGFGYGEAYNYPSSPSYATFTAYPSSRSNTVEHLAARFIRCRLFSTDPGTVDIVFDGQNSTQIALTAVIRKTDGTGVLERIPLDANNDAATSLSVPREEIYEVGFSISNSATSGTAVSFSITIDQSDALYLPVFAASASHVVQEMYPDQTDTGHLEVFNEGNPASMLHFEIAVESAKAVDWLSVDPLQGDLAGGTSTVLDLDFDTAGMEPGDYQANLIITHDADGSPVVVPVDLTVVVDPAAVGGGFTVQADGAHPNPFHPSTAIAWTIPAEGTATVDILDVNGRRIRTVWQGRLQAGPHTFPWDGRDDGGRAAAPGIYFARLRTEEGVSTTKMILAD